MIYKDRFFKLEMLVLSYLERNDYTYYELINTITQKTNHVMTIKAGVLLSTLFFFEESALISSYMQDHDIYYHIESAGHVRLETLKRNYHQMNQAICSILSDGENNEQSC